jgi:hypothetical protein
MQITENTCPPDREWIDWAIDRWLDLDPTSEQARRLLGEIWAENARRLLRRKPRRLRSRDILYRRDVETVRTAIWHRTRKMLRTRLREMGRGDLGLRSVPAARQLRFDEPSDAKEAGRG